MTSGAPRPFGETRESGTGHEVSVVVVSPEGPDVVRSFLSEAGVSVDNIYQSALEPLGIGGTPTVFVVDPRGVIQEEFVGKLSDAGEKRLLSIKNHLSPVQEPGKYAVER